ncbi:ampG domain protein [Rickettsia endosymbiont of Ixodes pacificus]|uniref:hypothetical protein n=1 Tax=Rickettsia endosymbiont of Ixodes pacificus TaxID=1133329 RepID=UPI00061F1F4A|nr:hypothetical protein [Rickettsia endosymbiont of Ixodes pacificus]KJW02340.1 ampG domain protein [Rickettsia endosymbiont of Ixodes pacificus]
MKKGYGACLVGNRHCEQALLRGSISPLSSRGLTTGSIKTIKNTNNFSIFNWIPRSSRGMTEVKLIHATMPCEQAVGCVAIS